MNQKILVFTENPSSRLNYVLNFISQIWEIDFQLCHEESVFNEDSNAKINYSNKNLDGFHIIPQGLLFQNKIENFDFSTLETDTFSMIFFLLSRYEEYLIKDKDQHGRFQPKSSYLYKTKRLNQPLVDVLIGQLKEKLQSKFPDLKFKSPTFKTQLTLDVDQAFMYQHKSFKRWFGAGLRDLSQFEFRNFRTRNLIYFGWKADPWNVFESIKNQFQNTENKPIFFFQVGDYGKFDKNLNYKNKNFKQLVKYVSSWAKVGLHPSYQSNDHYQTLVEEKLRLDNMIGKPVQISRQHFIKLQIPKTYENLINLGIKADYSMGYASQTGFRAGTSQAFFWYDLHREQQTQLKIHPFCAMDVSLKNYLKLNPEKARQHLTELYQIIEKNGGNFCLIAHNESLSGHAEWQDWPEIFLSFFNSKDEEKNPKN